MEPVDFMFYGGLVNFNLKQGEAIGNLGAIEHVFCDGEYIYSQVMEWMFGDSLPIETDWLPFTYEAAFLWR